MVRSQGRRHGDQASWHLGTDRAGHEASAQIFGFVVAWQLAEAPGQGGIHRCGTRWQIQGRYGFARRLQQFSAQQAGDRSIDTATADQMLLQPGRIPDHQSEGGCAVAAGQIATP